MQRNFECRDRAFVRVIWKNFQDETISKRVRINERISASIRSDRFISIDERSPRSEYNYPRGGRKIISACPTAMHHPREPIERERESKFNDRTRVRPDPRFPDFLVNLARVPFPTRSFRPAIDLLSRALDVSTSRSNFGLTRLISSPVQRFFFRPNFSK